LDFNGSTRLFFAPSPGASFTPRFFLGAGLFLADSVMTEAKHSPEELFFDNHFRQQSAEALPPSPQGERI
jgi:hypothetical protein